MPRWGWLLAGIVAVAAGLRFGTLGQQSLWYDEALTHDLVVQSFGNMISGVANTENTPPLSYALTWLSTRIFGSGEFGLRFVAALAGTATVPVAFLIGRELRNATAGLWAAALVAVNPMLVWFSQESRSYALLVFLTAIGLLCFLHALRPGRGGRALAGWVVASALALATHYFAIFPIAAEAAWLVWRHRLRVGRRVWVAVGAVGLAAAAIAPLALDQESSGRAESIGDESLARRVAQVPKQFLTGYDGPAQAALAVLSAALLVVACIGLWRHLREGGSGLAVVMIAAIAVGVPVVAALAGADFLNTRNVLAALPPVLVLAGVGFAAAPAPLGPPAGALLTTIGLATVVGVVADPVHQRAAWRSFDRALGASGEPRLLVVSPADAPVSLRVYREELAPAGEADAVVREIVVAGLAAKTSAGATATPPAPGGQEPPATGFSLVDSRTTETYTLLRYRSPTPVAIAPQALAASGLGDSPAVLHVPPSR